MHMWKYFFLVLLSICIPFVESSFAADINDQINVRNIDITTTNRDNPQLDAFVGNGIQDFFFAPSSTGGEGILDIFTTIAFQIKNFFIAIAILFLIYGVIKLLFSNATDEEVLAWKRNIIWTSVGIIVMQLAFATWNTLLLKRATDTVGSVFGWQFWTNVFSPIANLMLMFAMFGFLAMMVYAGYTMLTSTGDEEKMKKGKNIIFYAISGFILIQLPRQVVGAIYGVPDCQEKIAGLITIGDCVIRKQDLGASISILGKIVNYFNGFLAVICVILVIYAGWLVLISAGDEEKLKKARRIFYYILIGFLLLIASHALFRFVLLKG